MASFKVRYLIMRSGAAGALPRYFWQPNSPLRAEGWRPERVPLDWQRFQDADALQAAAIARAEELNRHMDATRAAAALAAVQPAAPPSTAPSPQRRTLGELIAAYEASADFTGLRDKTQAGYKQCLRKLETWGKDAPIRAITASRVNKLAEGLATTPAYANATVRVLRLVLEWGRRHDWLMVNPALRPRLVGTEPRGLIWPREAVIAFAELADKEGLASLGTAVVLNEWLGQREGDILRLPRSAYRNGSLVVRQSKTSATVALPVSMVPHLHARLETAMAVHTARAAEGKLAVTSILLAESTGRTWQGDHFRHAFAKLRAKLAKKQPRFAIEHLMPGQNMEDPHAFTVATTDLTFMALRHTAVTRGAEAGMTTAEISAISGHSEETVLAVLKRYTIRTAAIARGAFAKRMEAEGIEAVNASETGESDKKSDTV